MKNRGGVGVKRTDREHSNLFPADVTMPREHSMPSAAAGKPDKPSKCCPGWKPSMPSFMPKKRSLVRRFVAPYLPCWISLHFGPGFNCSRKKTLFIPRTEQRPE